MFLMRPVLAGMWTHREAIDGRFTVDDLLDAHELLDLKAENEQRAQSWAAAHRTDE